MSRALAEQEPEEASAAFAEARKIAPDHPDVWMLAAERALASDDVTASKAALDRVAKLRPGTIREAALRGGVAYAEWRPADVDAAIARVRDIDPTSAAGYRAAGEEAARKYRFEDAAACAQGRGARSVRRRRASRSGLYLANR
jgi:cytochrome c-type biogenesis protein CcmH/NrfG